MEGLPMAPRLHACVAGCRGHEGGFRVPCWLVLWCKRRHKLQWWNPFG